MPITTKATNSVLLTPACRMPSTTKNIPTAERTAPISWQRIAQVAAEQDDDAHDQRLEDERRPPVDPGGDHSADQRSRRGAEAPHSADRAERPRPRGGVGKPERRQDVHRRDQ